MFNKSSDQKKFNNSSGKKRRRGMKITTAPVLPLSNSYRVTHLDSMEANMVRFFGRDNLVTHNFRFTRLAIFQMTNEMGFTSQDKVQNSQVLFTHQCHNTE